MLGVWPPPGVIFRNSVSAVFSGIFRLVAFLPFWQGVRRAECILCLAFVWSRFAGPMRIYSNVYCNHLPRFVLQGLILHCLLHHTYTIFSMILVYVLPCLIAYITSSTSHCIGRASCVFQGYRHPYCSRFQPSPN